MYESGTEDLCTDLCIIDSMYTAVYIECMYTVCFSIYIVLEREEICNELQNTGNNSCVSCLGWRWHGERTVFIPRCSRAQRSVASSCREKCKQVVSGVRWVCDDVTCRFFTLELYKS